MNEPKSFAALERALDMLGHLWPKSETEVLARAELKAAQALLAKIAADHGGGVQVNQCEMCKLIVACLPPPLGTGKEHA